MKVVNELYHASNQEEVISTEKDSLVVTMLTTADNPFNPITQFDSWLRFDESKGYNTCAYLARIVKTSDELSETDQNLAIQMAIDEIIRMNVLGIYKKVTA